jgi:Fe-S-cluster-containing dehydrogenase component
MPPEAVGFLFDSTLCVGCKACVSACKQANDVPMVAPVREPYLDPSVDIGGKALNVIKAFVSGKAQFKDREEDGFAFVKKSCMHCVDPSCVSVCPVSAMQKDPVTGIVSYDKDRCIGCRYCVVSCPFGVPRFEYDTAFPQIRKCELCRHLQVQGKIPACAEACPTGATLFGPVAKLKEEARRRLSLKAGTEDKPERRFLGSGEQTRARASPKYLDYLYGEKELGGTQMLMLAGVPFAKLGMPDLPERSFAARSETVQHSIYAGMVAPALGVIALMAIIGGHLKHRDHHNDHKEH